VIPFFASQVRNRLNETEVEADETRKGKGKRVESEDAARSDRVVNSESPTPLQSGNMKQIDALFGTVACGHSGVVEGLSLFPSALPRLPPPREH